MALVASSFCEICFIVTGNFELLASLEILNLFLLVQMYDAISSDVFFAKTDHKSFELKKQNIKKQ